MLYSEFEVGKTFKCGGKTWLCTDKGTRVVIAICLSFCRTNDWGRGLPEEQQERAWKPFQEAELPGMPEADPSWFNGPPYAVAEHVFDENDIKGCVP